MGKCHLHLGSNQGNRIFLLAKALQMIELGIGPIIASSAFYETAAWGKIDQPDFINIAIEVEHFLSPNSLLKEVNKIEHSIGRVRKEKWGPRQIDIDIIFIEDLVIETKSLTIPHKWISKRRFVLAPLADIAPDFLHPVLEVTVKELLVQCHDETEINKIELE